MKLTNTTLSDKDLYALCKEYGQKARLWKRRFAGLLPEVFARGLYKRRHFGSIHEFAAKLAGMGKESVDKVLRLSKKLQDKPRLLEQLETGSQAWTKLERVAFIATPETDGEWAERVETLASGPLSLLVQNSRLDLTASGNSQPEKEEVRFEVRPELAGKLNQLKKRADFENLLEKFVKSVEAQEQAEKPKAVTTPSRHIPSQMDRHVRARTNDLCAFPGCAKLGTSLHHTQRWALENIHDPNRLHLVCTAHEQLAHHGYIENEDQSPEHWRLKAFPDTIGPKAYIDSLVNLHRGG